MFNNEKPNAATTLIRTVNLSFKEGYLGTQGLLFIGDPHLWSKRPGRRRDVSYLDTILEKLTKIANISNNNHLLPVFLGDLFHEDDDSEPEMLVKIIKVLQLFNRKPVTIVGNHEKDEWVLKEKNALALLKVTGLIDVIEKNSFWGKIALTDPETGIVHNVAIGGTPYGQTIPYDLTSFICEEGGTSIREDLDKENTVLAKEKVKSLAGRSGVNLLSESNVNEHILPNNELNNYIHEKLDCKSVIWLTHHDLAFENTYPNSIPLHNIDGVDMMINGHIHGTKKPVKVGNTACYNPGNISRLSIDMSEHLPSVWMWNPFLNKIMPSAKGVSVPHLEQIVLPHVSGEEIFNFEGRHTQKSLIEVLPEEIEHSVFVELLNTENNSNNKTDDGIYLKESMDQIFNEKETSEPVKLILENLFHRALKE